MRKHNGFSIKGTNSMAFHFFLNVTQLQELQSESVCIGHAEQAESHATFKKVTDKNHAEKHVYTRPES
jgi:hypothetical protein